MYPEERRTYARHEAAHAVIWILHGYDILSTTVAATSEQIAQGIHGQTIHGDYAGPGSPGSRAPALAWVIGMLAAGEYEEKLTGVPSKGLVKDFELINEYLKNHRPKQNARLVCECYDRLDSLFDAEDVCSAIEELAQVLMQRDVRVEGSEVRTIVTKYCAARMAAISSGGGLADD
jgi:hypothetical protein